MSTKLLIDGPVLAAATLFYVATCNLIREFVTLKTSDGENCWLVLLCAGMVVGIPVGVMFLVVWLGAIR